MAKQSAPKPNRKSRRAGLGAERSSAAGPTKTPTPETVAVGVVAAVVDQVAAVFEPTEEGR